jgi:hypothetical protein
VLDRAADGRLAAQARRGAWVLGAILLFVLGLAFVVAPLVGSGGWILLALAVPPLAAGAAAFGRVRAVRAIGPLVALAYAIVIGTVATTSPRGLTPPPGAAMPSIDPFATLLAGAFLVAAILLALGTPDPLEGRLTRPRRRTLVALGAVLVLVGVVLYD